jgi:hypothetical protein
VITTELVINDSKVTTLTQPSGNTLSLTVPVAHTLNLAFPGPQGSTGISTGIVEVLAGEVVGGQRPVSLLGGQAYATDISSVESAITCIGVSLHAADAGATLRVQCGGLMTEPTWTWSNGPVYVSDTKTLTQTPPATGALIHVGIAQAPTGLVIEPAQPIMGA